MIICKPTQHDLLSDSRMGNKAEFEFYDKEHVRNLYLKTEEQISQRLGLAITRRRKYLFYRDRHQEKPEKGIEETQGVQRTTTESAMSETIATDSKTPTICTGLSLTPGRKSGPICLVGLRPHAVIGWRIWRWT